MAVTALLTLATGTAPASAHPTVVAHTTDASANGPVVVAIGDSIMEGHGLEAGQAWPALLAEDYGWRLTNLASDGSGFVTVGNNDDTFANQVSVAVELHPSIVLVSGSSNDLGVNATVLSAQTVSTIDRLRTALPHAEIIAVSPVCGATSEPSQLRSIDSEVVSAVGGVGGDDVQIGQPLLDQPALMQGDGVHPTAVGQETLAAAIETGLTANGIATG